MNTLCGHQDTLVSNDLCIFNAIHDLSFRYIFSTYISLTVASKALVSICGCLNYALNTNFDSK